MGFGVLTGSISVVKTSAIMSGSPASTVVGISGAPLRRCTDVTARMRTLPAR
jgi:hypothetical protein